ncbi:ABC transporter ATP-binding protein [Thioalkalicoccus limnaeus]|uniref:ABC transporter ATP-binding protein n=1 Tax=Thioalkalicoccus limnaeus TaxID=120681 RepID=A0ABV4BF52_9GAMM
MPKQLDVHQVSVAYDNVTIVSEVSFCLGEGQIGCLLGPSGCGKTTLLRAIAGFEPIITGSIQLHGRVVSRPGDTLAPERRRVGMVFQDYALFPHLTVERNIAFGLRGLSAAQRHARVIELLRLVDLEPARKFYPHQLSGGMQQRVAVARAMAPRPDILLLDEPFSNIDAERREQLAREIRELLKRDEITAILVTHDQLEAFAMADQIGVMGAGRLHQWGSGFELYHEPADRFVADFIGQGVLLPAEVIGETRVATPLGQIAGRKPHGLAPGHAAEVLIRPDDLSYDEASPIRGHIIARAFRGAEYLYRVRLANGAEVLCLVPSRHHHGLGDEIGLRLHADHLVLFASESQR